MNNFTIIVQWPARLIEFFVIRQGVSKRQLLKLNVFKRDLSKSHKRLSLPLLSNDALLPIVNLNDNIEIAPYIEPVMQWLQSISIQDWTWVGVVAHFLLTLFIIIRILSNQRNTGVTIAWLAVLFALPFIGIIAYILLGEPYLGKRYNERSLRAREMFDTIADENKLLFSKVDKSLPNHQYGVSRIGLLDTGFGVYNNHRMQLLTAADDTFAAIIEDINQAKTLVLMEFYIVYPKGRVLDVFAALIRARRRGVECQILADSVGSFSFFTDDWHNRLIDEGVNIHQSLPVGLFKTLFKRSDLRNHRKIIVIDRLIGYTGSFNLVDPQFFKQNAKVGQWIDVMMRIQSQDAVSVVSALTLVNIVDISAESRRNLDALSDRIDNRLNEYTRKLYRPSPTINDLNDKVSVHDTMPDHIAEKLLAEEVTTASVSKSYGKKLEPKNIQQSQSTVLTKTTNNQEAQYDELTIPPMPVVDNVLAQLIPSAPKITSQVIYDTLLTVLHRANKRIQMTTPYFVPDEALLAALTTAAKRGVSVTLIVPKKVDSFLVQHASQSSYAILLDAGVNIALFEGGLLHAKTVVIDDDYCLFGTVNMDMRSFYLNMELSLALYTPEMVTQVLTCQHAYLTQCEWLDAYEWNKRPKYMQLFDSFIQLFSPLL